MVDAERAVGAQAGHFQDDWHLTVEGNAVVAEAFGRMVLPMLRELERTPSIAVATDRTSVADPVVR